MKNKGFEPAFIQTVKNEIQKTGNEFIWLQKDENNDFAAFQFIGKREGKEVVFDAFLTTLEMEYYSDILEDAVNAVIDTHPEYEDADFDAEEGHHIELMESYAKDLSVDDEYDVCELLEIGAHGENGLELEISLHIPEIDDQVIEDFIQTFNRGTFKLDPTFYSFSKE